MQANASGLKDLNTYYGTAYKTNQVLVDDIDSINQQILNLLGTNPGEILFEPDFGSLVQRYLFEPIDSATAYNIKIWVMEAMMRWLPFIDMIPSQSSVIPDEINQGYNIKITYSIRNTDKIGNVQAQLTRG